MTELEELRTHLRAMIFGMKAMMQYIPDQQKMYSIEKMIESGEKLLDYE